MTQHERILQILKDANGDWVCGQYFNDPPVRISQFHTRIHELQKAGYKIIPSDFKNEYGFKSYRLATDKVDAFLAEHPSVVRQKANVLF
jgi:hypothetical protein